MKHLPWIALMLVAAPASSDTKTKSVGFYRLATVTAEGKKIDIVGAMYDLRTGKVVAV